MDISIRDPFFVRTSQMISDINKEFLKLFERGDHHMGDILHPWMNKNRSMMSTDIEEHADKYVVRMDVPGVTIADLSVRVERNILIVEGERKRISEKCQNVKQPKYAMDENNNKLVSKPDDAASASCISERYYGKFRRSMPIPDDANIHNDVDARLHHGVLTIVFKRHTHAEHVQPNRIHVNDS